MNKCYYRIVWENYPSDKTPLNEQNLNKIDVAVDEMDNRIISIDATKFDKSEAQLLVKYIEYDEDTGIFKITHYNGASYTIDTLLEKLAINFDYDYQTQRLIIELSDGTVKYVDLSSLVTQYEFLDSETVAFTLDSSGKVTAKVKEGSIEEKHLRPDYLADIKVEVAKAQASQQAAATSEINAKKSADAAKASETVAKESETSAAESKKNAADSASVAASKATEAAESAATSATSADNAKNSETNAKTSETNAENSKIAAATSAANANASAVTAGEKATEASNYADEAESFAHGGTGTRPGEDTDNAMEYARQAKESADKAYGIAGGDYFIPNSQKGAADGVATLGSDGKVPKSQLPSDIGSVTGVKGSKEAHFRTGNVDITPENVGALPLSGGTMDQGSSINFGQRYYDDSAIIINSEDGCHTTISPNFVEIRGNGERTGFLSADEVDTDVVLTQSEDLTHEISTGRKYPVLDTNNAPKYIQQLASPLVLPSDVRVGNNVILQTNGEGGNLRLIAPDNTWWEIDAYNGNLRIFTYANGVKTGITITKMGQVYFNEGLYGTLYGNVIAKSQDNKMGARIDASGFHVDMPLEAGYAGGMTWYQGDTAVGLYGYYNQGGYHYVGTNYENPAGELRTGVIRANSHIYIKYGFALYVRHLEGADGGNLFLNYGHPDVAVAVGDTDNSVGGIGILQVGKRAQLWTDTEGGNLSLMSPNDVEYQIDAYNDNLRLFRRVGDDYRVLLTSGSDGYLVNGYGIQAPKLCGINSALILKPNAGISSIYDVILGYVPEIYQYSFYPNGTAIPLGNPNHKWGEIYSTNAVIQTSDRNEKKNINPLDDELTKDFVMGLITVSYKFIENTSDRTHYGLIAQDVEELMESLGISSKDFAGIIKSPKMEEYEAEEEIEVEKLIPDESGKPMPQNIKEIQKVTKRREIPGEYRYGLRYEEFIAPTIKFCQMLQDQVDDLKAENQELKDRLARVEKMLGI